MNITYNEYYKQTQAIVDELLERLDDGEFNDDELDDQLHEAIDRHEYIIYTGKSLAVLVHSNNWTEIDDMEHEFQDMSSTVTVAAYWAMLADVREILDRKIEERGDE